LHVLLQAWDRVLQAHPSPILLLAGEGEQVAGGSELGSLQALAQRFGESVRIVGPIPEARLAEFYSLCDVFAFPSISPLESFGMAQVEAMRCGTPVVASDLPGVREPVQRTTMGLLARRGNSASLADSLNRILQSPATFRQPLESIEQLFSLEKTARAYEALIEGRPAQARCR
jgi:glycosyltransferase involved in cell wall biosynthesis